MAQDLRIIKRALISVSDKTGLDKLVPLLVSYGIEIYSTGGTAKALADMKMPHQDISKLTGFPEIMDGRVKTLHPLVHGGILGKPDKPDHAKAIAEHNIKPFDLIVVNLYPFSETVAKGADYDTCVENIDVGGPAMIRAAAKNHSYVTIITDPNDYKELIESMGINAGEIALEFRKRMAMKAFALTSRYDAAIVHWMNAQANEEFPQSLNISGTRQQTLRYGENPQQRAALYLNPSQKTGLAYAKQMQGKELSYNNILDSDAALELICEFDAPSIAIIKHANPCGVASADDLAAAYKKALACDPVSAFGGIIAMNRKLDAATATAITEIFTEVVIAPDADEDAIKLFAKKPNLRLLLLPNFPARNAEHHTIRSISGGYLVQSRDGTAASQSQIRVVTKRQPSAEEIQDLLFAERVGKHVKSNAIVYAKNLSTVGIGAGQMSRIDSARIAKSKAAELKLELRGSVAASDAFFPFADGLETIADAGTTAIIQPGGSMRDNEVIEAADKAGIAMVFTGTRHFRH